MTVKTDLSCLEKIPNIDSLSNNFTFVEDLVLRKNIAIIFQYLIFLITLEESHTLPGAISYLIYKDMIIQTASIAESLLCYGLLKSVEKGKATLEEMKITENKYRDFKKVFEISRTESAGAVIKTQKIIEPLEMQFNDLIPAANHIGLISDALRSELDILRSARNKIHLSSLHSVDDAYSKAEVKKRFSTVKKLKESIIAYLTV